MKRIRKATRVMSAIVIAIFTALAVTVLCAPEEDRIELAEVAHSLNDQEEPEKAGLIGIAFL